MPSTIQFTDLVVWYAVQSCIFTNAARSGRQVGTTRFPVTEMVATLDAHLAYDEVLKNDPVRLGYERRSVLESSSGRHLVPARCCFRWSRERK